jgi:hypothetical protein
MSVDAMTTPVDRRTLDVVRTVSMPKNARAAEKMRGCKMNAPLVPTTFRNAG